MCLMCTQRSLIDDVIDDGGGGVHHVGVPLGGGGGCAQASDVAVDAVDRIC